MISENLLKNAVIIEPLGGLGNRMRSLNSALFLARKIRKPLVVVWVTQSGTNCPFSKLFKLPGSITVIEHHTPLAVWRLSWRFRDNRVVRRLRNFYRRSITRNYTKHAKRIIAPNEMWVEAEMGRLLEGRYDFNDLANCGSVYISTCRRFYDYTKFDDFEPVREIQDAVDAVTRGFPDNIIGIHIRRTDPTPLARLSRTELFIELMKAEIEKNKDTKFYLATDSSEEKTRLGEIFRDRMIVSPVASTSRDCVNGIQGALADMMCLARTKKIIGSYDSSFSDVAAEIYGIDKVVVGKSDNKRIQ